MRRLLAVGHKVRFVISAYCRAGVFTRVSVSLLFHCL